MDEPAYADAAADALSGAGSGPVTCATCGGQEPALPSGWSLQVGPRGRTWLCDGCTRENLRSIEGRLDEAWW